MTMERNDLPIGGERRRVMDIINALLSAWLFISPWLLVYGWVNRDANAWNTWIVSAIIFLVSLAGLSRPAAWHELVNMALGAWMFISPWVFAGVHTSSGAAWNQRIIGALIFLVSAAFWAARRGIAIPGMEQATTTAERTADRARRGV